MRVWWSILILVACGIAHAQDAPSTLRMRAGFESPAGQVVSLDLQGVTVRQADKSEVISWDRIVEVKGPLAPSAKAFAEHAANAWRARTRLERADFVAAEPLFDTLARTYAGTKGPTAAVVAEGLLRCRLRRGVQTAAVAPWLAWLQSSEDGRPVPAMNVELPPGAPPVIDPATGLCPSLPPIWLRLPSVEALARGDLLDRRAAPTTQTPPAKDSKSDPDSAGGSAEFRSVTLSRLYQLAAQFETGQVSDVTLSQVPIRSVDAGLAIVAQIVGARAGDEALRKDCRVLLTERLRQRPAQWLEAWLRVGIGRSLLRESAAEERLLGVAAMLHVPARLRGASPYLAGLALADAAMQEFGNGNTSSAWTLKRELTESFPGHPALDVEVLRQIRPGTPAKASGPTPSPTAKPIDGDSGG